MSITSLNKPTIDSTGWGANVNQNFTDIENFAKGTEAAQAIQVDNLNLNGNTISSTDTNGDINLAPNGTGSVIVSADGLAIVDSGSPGVFMINTSGSADNQNWSMVIGATNLMLLAMSDDFGSSATAMEVVRSDVAISSVAFPNGNVGVGTSSPSSRLHVVGDLSVDNINIDGNTIISTDTNGNINIAPNGTGKVVLDGLNWPTADGSDGQVLTTDGSGNLAFDDAGGGGAVLLSTQSASSSSTIDFTNDIDGTYKRYEINIMGAVPSTDNTHLKIQVSTDSGSTWKSGSTDYDWALVETNTAGGPSRNSSAGNSSIFITRHDSEGIGNSSGESYSGNVFFNDPASSSLFPLFFHDGCYVNKSGSIQNIKGSGRYKTVGAIDGIRILPSTGTIASGTFKLYGIT